MCQCPGNSVQVPSANVAKDESIDSREGLTKGSHLFSGGCPNPGGSVKQLSERGLKEEGERVKTVYD